MSNKYRALSKKTPMYAPRLVFSAGMNIESLLLLSSQSFAIEYTLRPRIAGSRPPPKGDGLFPLAKRREKNSCFSHSEARLPSRSRKGRPQTRAFPRSDAMATSCFPKRRFHGDRSESFGGLPSPNHPHLPPRPAAPKHGDLRYQWLFAPKTN